MEVIVSEDVDCLGLKILHYRSRSGVYGFQRNSFSLIKSKISKFKWSVKTIENQGGLCNGQIKWITQFWRDFFGYKYSVAKLTRWWEFLSWDVEDNSSSYKRMWADIFFSNPFIRQKIYPRLSFHATNFLL